MAIELTNPIKTLTQSLSIYARKVTEKHKH